MAPSKQLAVIVNSDGSATVQETDVKKPGPGEILVKVVAAAQNPTDWKTVKYGKFAGSISGCDFAGVVEEIGPDVPEGLRTVGERVAAFVHGGRYPNGAFSEYLIALADRVLHIPDSWSFEDAAQYGVAPLTACQTLWESQSGLPTPLSPASSSGSPTPILIWGGASSVGNYVIQFAKLSGLYVLTTASPKNFELVKSLGADEVFDYKDLEVSSKIKESTKGKLSVAVDCVGTDETVKGIEKAFSEEGGIISAIVGTKTENPKVKILRSIAYDLIGKAYDFPRKWTPTAEDIQRGKETIKLAQEIWNTEKIKPSPKLIMPKGLASVPDGFKYMIDGKVSGEKITYRIADTPRA